MANMVKTTMPGEVMNNCIRPPHYPPHCGCPAGVVSYFVGGEHDKTGDGQDNGGSGTTQGRDHG